MSLLRVALIQMRSGVNIAENIAAATDMMAQAAGEGADLVCTPEMTGLLDIRPGEARNKIRYEGDDRALTAFCATAERLGIWLLIGSLAVRMEEDERFANRSFLISPAGKVFARYDKIHMFDVEVGDGQSYRESRSYKPGERAVVADTDIARIGMTVCYDVRFPHLYRALGQAGAEIITCPAAFTKVTGKAHWHTLLRARAIETGCFVLAPAQGGLHEDGRETFGHSLIISPWGEIIAEAQGDDPGVLLADIDLADVNKARTRIPSLGLDADLDVSIFGG